MTYTKTTWVASNTPVTAANMNHIEDGIVALDVAPKVPTVVDGQWLKGVGGAAVWSAIAAADVLPAGGSGQYLKGPASSPTWAAPSAPPGTLIAYAQYSPVGSANVNMGTSNAAWPVSQLAVTFTAPASGAVLVKCSVACQAQWLSINGEAAILCAMFSAGVAIGYNQKIFSSNIGSYSYVRGNFVQVFTGLTPGNSYTLTPNFMSINTNQGYLFFGSGVAGSLGTVPNYGPGVTEVYST